MKIRARKRLAGSLLIATLVICMLVGIMLTAYLAMVSQQQTFTQRSQIWNHCIPMCEAGVEEAMAHLNHSSVSNDFTVHEWKFVNGAYRKTRDLNNGFCLIAIDTNLPPKITVEGSLRAPLHTVLVTRTIEVQTKYNQQFANGMLARGAINMNGSASIDSFNSTNAQESTNGQYDPSRATDHASVATTSQNTGDFKIGNVTIYGTVATGPGGVIDIGPSGNVGSTQFNNDPANNGSVEPGHSTDDVNVYIPPSALPEGWGSPAPPDKGTVGDTEYTYVLRDGDYQINSNFTMEGKQNMIVVGKARLYVTGATSVAGQAYIRIDAGGSVEWYAGGNVSLRGGAVQNSPGYAKDFSLIGLPGCADISLSGDGTFVGTIYAPDANLLMTGSAVVMGAVVGKTITVRGNLQFHYDEALRRDPKRGRFFVHSWRELP